MQLHFDPPFHVASWRLVLAILLGLTASARADDLTRAAKELRVKYAAQLEQLAAWCDEHKLTEQARKTRSWLGVRDPNKLYIAELPERIGPPDLPEGASPELVEWNNRFWLMRRQVAAVLEKLARRAVAADRASLAFDLAMAAARENPDHEAIRRLLGYQKFQGAWHTLYEIDKLRTNQVWHEKFGWLPKNQVRRYEQGERFSQGRWVSGEEDARMHPDIRNGWVIETEHYRIVTNHSFEAGVALATKLERLFQVWRQLFIRYFATEAQVRDLFDGRPRKRLPSPQFKVAYFRTRDDYNKALRPIMPNIEVSIGVYVENTRTAYFFAGDDYDERTLYHEATHQLFHETRPVSPAVGAQGNFWIIEGIAMYMESLHQEDGFHVLGGFDDLRMKAARYRLLHDNFYIPLTEFSAINIQKLQTDKRIATLYSQAAGLTHFLIHSDNGRYRDSLVAYLSSVYSGLDHPQTLSQLTRVPMADLDAQYKEFMKSGAQPKEKPAKEKTESAEEQEKTQ